MRTLVLVGALVVVGRFSSWSAMAMQSNPSSPPNQYLQTQSVAPASEESAVLRGQLETMRFYDQRLLQTVYWSLAGVLMLAVLLAGFQWFATQRAYDRDLSALRATLQAYTTEELGKIRDRIEGEQRSQIESAKKSLNEAMTETVSRKEYQEDSRKIWFKLRDIERNSAITEGEHWESKEVYFNAARSYCKAIQIGLETNFPMFIETPLEALDRCLKKIPKRGARQLADAGNLADISETLAKVPPQYKIVVDSVLRSLQEFATS
jgi:hypothetical protein